MCLAKKYADQINEIIHKAQNDLDDFWKQQSEVDKELSQKYHEIETTKFNAYEGFCLAKSLQTTLQRRRHLKHELAQMQKLVKGFENTKIENKIKGVQKSIEYFDKGHLTYTENFSVNIGDVLKDKLQLN